MFENSKYLNNLLWEFSKNSKPYPFALIDNFLKDDIYQTIKDRFPSLSQFEKKGDIKGNNIQIRIAYNDFSSIVDPFWKGVLDFTLMLISNMRHIKSAHYVQHTRHIGKSSFWILCVFFFQDHVWGKSF